MERDMDPESSNHTPVGAVSAVTAFLIWGFCPVFYKALVKVPPFEILMHRMVWSFIFLLPLILLMHRWKSFAAAFKTPRTFCMLFASTLLVGCNWFVFIWAINNDHILQASLGYYINPLVNVVLAMVFLRERLSALQVCAVILALAGVLYMTFSIGVFPWVALTLAVTFSFYGLIRKVVPVPAMEGLGVETMLLFLPAAGYLYLLHAKGVGAFFRIGWQMDLLLMATALVTAVPLLLFTVGARCLNFITIGFMQYIGPSCAFLLAICVYREPFSGAQAVTFLLIWVALALFTVDAVSTWRKAARGMAASAAELSGRRRSEAGGGRPVRQA